MEVERGTLRHGHKDIRACLGHKGMPWTMDRDTRTWRPGEGHKNMNYGRGTLRHGHWERDMVDERWTL